MDTKISSSSFGSHPRLFIVVDVAILRPGTVSCNRKVTRSNCGHAVGSNTHGTYSACTIGFYMKNWSRELVDHLSSSYLILL